MKWVRKKLGNYNIESEISQGGFAVVYRAYQPQLDRWVALKVLLPKDEETHQAFLQSFRTEAKAIAALRHPNIVKIYDYGEEDELAYLVMEYVDGGTLKEQLKQAPFSWKTIAPIIIPIGLALSYAHSQGIVHRDVKPGNILLPRADWPLLTDFGLRKLRFEEHTLDEVGLLSGTPAYASPEQIAGGHVGQRSDIYGLGTVIYELLSGHLPFYSKNTYDIMVQRLAYDPSPLSVHLPNIDPELEAIVSKMLARKPPERYPSMEAALNDLIKLPDSQMVEAGLIRPLGQQSYSTRVLKTDPLVAGPHLVVPGSNVVLLLEKEDVTLGRLDPDSPQTPDIDLNPHGGIGAGVSRLHARLHKQGNGWLVSDLDSTNGTFINQNMIQPGETVPIFHGNELRVGSLVLVFFEKNVTQKLQSDIFSS